MLLLAGCVELPDRPDLPVHVRVSLDPAANVGPRHTPVNHLGLVALPPEVRRVVLLPVSGGELLPPETAAGLDPVFAAALQRRMRFEVVPVSRAWCRRISAPTSFPPPGRCRMISSPASARARGGRPCCLST